MRQIRLMEQRIKEYKEYKISIGLLITDFEALVYRLQYTPKSIIDNFIDLWWELEIPYAVALNQERDVFTDDEVQRIRTALDGLERLIHHYKEHYLPSVKELDDEELAVELD